MTPTLTDHPAQLFLNLGFIFFALFLYWLTALWRELSEAWYTPGPERIWILSSLAIGILYAICAGIEWGVVFAGTAFSVGLCIALALMSPGAAAPLLASSLFLRPWELVLGDSYLSILPRLSFVLCLAHLGFGYAKSKKIVPVWSPVGLYLVAFCLWCFVTTLFAPDPGASQSEFFDGFTKCILLYFILTQMTRSKLSLRILVVSLLMSFLFVGTVSLVTVTDSRLKGFGAFANSNDIAALMVLILPFAVVRALRESESVFLRSTSFVLALVAFLCVILSRSRGAMLGVAVSFGVYLILRMGKKVIVPLLVGLLFLAIPSAVLVSDRTEEDLKGSSAGRVTYLKAGFRMGIKNPIFGVGFGGFPASLQTYTTESLEESNQMTAHNSWVLVFAETGFIGLLLFCGALFWSARSAFHIYSNRPEYLLSMTGYGVSMVFLSHSYLLYPYLLLALVQSASSMKSQVKGEA